MTTSGPAVPSPRVGVVMGSASDWATLSHAAATLAELEIPHERAVVSAHRTPDLLRTYALSAAERGLEVVIAGAGARRTCPGCWRRGRCCRSWACPSRAASSAASTPCSPSSRCPPGSRSGRSRSARPGRRNAALLAARMLAVRDPALRARLAARRDEDARRSAAAVLS